MAETALLTPGLIVADTYEIDRLLGRGGMGEVWLAKHRRLAGKQVAIKVLRLEGTVSKEALARFRREAEIAVRFEHPNIVQVLDFNTLPSGEPFLVMELLKGESLAQRLTGGRLALPAVQQVVRQVGAALQAAHRAGVVHRDLKPENIFLVPTSLGDQVKVLDFGISKLADSQTVMTTDAVLIGTPLYMSPEQALGNNRDVTAQSDLFSMGSICYELLTGEPPFSAESVARVVFRIAYEKHVPLGQARADLPASVVAAVEHALEKERSRRTADIDTFVLELTGEPLAIPTPSTSSGVIAPGMSVSESLMSGKTVNPSPERALATPGPIAAARRTSGTKLLVGLLGGVVLLSGGMISWRKYLVSIMPADAGVVVPVTSAEPPATTADAGTEPGQLDAGVVLVIDAGIRPATPPTHVVEVAADTPSPKDQARLTELTAARDRGDWEYLEAQRSSVRGLDSRTARARAMSLVVLGMCHRASNVLLGTAIEELKRVASPSLVRSARRDCEAVYPSASSMQW